MRRASTLQPLKLNGRGLALLVGTLALLGLAIGIVVWYGVR
jgi:hypothetical protein